MTNGPIPRGDSNGPRISPGILVGSRPAAALAAETRVRGVASLRVRRNSLSRRECASRPCPWGRVIHPSQEHVRVTYIGPADGESFHTACYRWEFIA